MKITFLSNKNRPKITYVLTISLEAFLQASKSSFDQGFAFCQNFYKTEKELNLFIWKRVYAINFVFGVFAFVLTIFASMKVTAHRQKSKQQIFQNKTSKHHGQEKSK